MTMTAKEFFKNLAKKNTIFSCVTTRKNDKKVDGVVVAKKGEEISSTYRLNVPATKKWAADRLAPGVRKASDNANNIITAYDMTKVDANGEHGAFRRINLAGIKRVKTGGEVFTVKVEENGELMMVKSS